MGSRCECGSRWGSGQLQPLESSGSYHKYQQLLQGYRGLLCQLYRATSSQAAKQSEFLRRLYIWICGEHPHQLALDSSVDVLVVITLSAVTGK